jgi:hypothetical protein
LNAIGTLEEEDAKLYFAEMISSVKYLHSLGYIHRFHINQPTIRIQKQRVSEVINQPTLNNLDFVVSGT